MNFQGITIDASAFEKLFKHDFFTALNTNKTLEIFKLDLPQSSLQESINKVIDRKYFTVNSNTTAENQEKYKKELNGQVKFSQDFLIIDKSKNNLLVHKDEKDVGKYKLPGYVIQDENKYINLMKFHQFKINNVLDKKRISSILDDVYHDSFCSELDLVDYDYNYDYNCIGEANIEKNKSHLIYVQLNKDSSKACTIGKYNKQTNKYDKKLELEWKPIKDIDTYLSNVHQVWIPKIKQKQAILTKLTDSLKEKQAGLTQFTKGLKYMITN